MLAIWGANWRARLLIGGVLIVAATAMACGEGGGTAATPTQSTARAPTPQVSPKAQQVPQRTGIADLDAIIEAFILHDTKSLLPHLRYSVLPCGVEPGMGGSPTCRADQEIGALVEVMPFSACEFGYYRPHEFEPILADLGEQQLHGVFAATPEARFPGDHVLILTKPRPDEPEKEIATEVSVKDGRIVGVYASCVQTAEELVREHKLGEPVWAP